MKNLSRFRSFVAEFTRLVERAGGDESRLLDEGSTLLAALVSHDDWLPEECAQPHAQYYQQFLLYCDPLERFSVVSFVWGPGHTTPVHDHTVWGLVGVLRGAEICEEFERSGGKQPMRKTGEHRIEAGGIDAVSPTVGDIHTVSNALADRPSISIHVYGANIGAVRRHIYVPETGAIKSFVSGYSNNVIPNLWDRSAGMRPG